MATQIIKRLEEIRARDLDQFSAETLDEAIRLAKEQEYTHELTKDEAKNVAEFIGDWLIESIRSNPDIDNINWIKNMISAYDKLKEYSGFVGLYDNPKESGERITCCRKCKYYICVNEGNDYYYCGNAKSDNYGSLREYNCEDFEQKEIE